MKDQKTDTRAAQALLEQKGRGWSIAYAMKGMRRRFFLYAVLLFLALALLWLSLFRYYFFILIAGIVTGAFLRDIGWLILIKKRWSFTEKITDWDKVKEIAGQ